MAFIDKTGEKIKISDEDVFRLDGLTIFRKVVRDGVIYLQFKDHDKMRSKCRGTYYMEIPLDILVEKLRADAPAVSGE